MSAPPTFVIIVLPTSAALSFNISRPLPSSDLPIKNAPIAPTTFRIPPNPASTGFTASLTLPTPSLTPFAVSSVWPNIPRIEPSGPSILPITDAIPFMIGTSVFIKPPIPLIIPPIASAPSFPFKNASTMSISGVTSFTANSCSRCINDAMAACVDSDFFSAASFSRYAFLFSLFSLDASAASSSAFFDCNSCTFACESPALFSSSCLPSISAI